MNENPFGEPPDDADGLFDFTPVREALPALDYELDFPLGNADHPMAGPVFNLLGGPFAERLRYRKFSDRLRLAGAIAVLIQEFERCHPVPTPLDAKLAKLMEGDL